MLGLCLASCIDLGRRRPGFREIQPEAYVPVYSQDPEANTIKALPPQPIVESGKIYVWGNYLFQVERLAGVHIIDYSDKSNPKKLGFIKSRGCTELAVKGNYLIINNMTDLVSIDLANPVQGKEASRIKDAFPHFMVNSVPPYPGYYYVCPEPGKGIITSWKLEKNVKGANCFH